MSSSEDTETFIKNTIQSYIDRNNPGIEFRLFKFNSRKEYCDLTGYLYWTDGYVVEYHGKGYSQQGTISGTSLRMISGLGGNMLANAIEKHTRLCVNLLLTKIEVELGIKILSNRIEKDKI